MDKFYCQKKTPQKQNISGWAVIIHGLITIAFMIFSELQFAFILVYPSLLTLLFLHQKRRQHDSKATPNLYGTYILFGKKTLIYRHNDTTKWYIDYSRLSAVRRNITEAKGLNPKIEEIFFTTDDNDSYAIPQYTFTDKQLTAIQNRIDKIKKNSVYPIMAV